MTLACFFCFFSASDYFLCLYAFLETVLATSTKINKSFSVFQKTRYQKLVVIKLVVFHLMANAHCVGEGENFRGFAPGCVHSLTSEQS